MGVIGAFLVRFWAEVRRQSAPATETRPFRNLRRAVANLSLIPAFIVGPAPLLGDFRGGIIACWVACMLGLVLAAGVYVRDPWISKRFGRAAFALSVAGFVGYLLLWEPSS
ncbi:MAG TPA: hypothetical protein VNV66_00260 [Pilimelia sp.]|nr:hypothetical protein [Pilimelia sp.]